MQKGEEEKERQERLNIERAEMEGRTRQEMEINGRKGEKRKEGSTLK